MAGGFLSGKYRRGQPKPKGTRLSDTNQEFDEQKAYGIIDELDRIAKSHGSSVSQTALNYLLNKPGVTSVIIGVRTPEQLADNLKSVDCGLLPEEVTQLDKVSKPLPVYPYDFLSRGYHD